MQFRVNEGQRIPQLVTEPGKPPERRILVGGDVVEGPPFWIEEFAGRMTPLDDKGNPIDQRAMAGLVDLATAKAHERVSILEEMIRANPGVVGDALQPQLDKAKADAEQARLEMEARRAAKESGPQPQRLEARRAVTPANNT